MIFTCSTSQGKYLPHPKRGLSKYFKNKQTLHGISFQTLESNDVDVWVLTACKRSLGQGNVSEVSVCPRGKGVLYDVTSCLAAWSHVTLGGGGLSRGFSVKGVSVREIPHLYSEERAVHILLECFLVLYRNGHLFTKKTTYSVDFVINVKQNVVKLYRNVLY